LNKSEKPNGKIWLGQQFTIATLNCFYNSLIFLIKEVIHFMPLARKVAVARAVTPGPGPAVKGRPVAKAAVLTSPGRRRR
jgi:hypothetical protein